MTEEWKEYEFKNLKYKVSNYGRIIGLGRNKELKTRLNYDGYLYVTLGESGNRTSRPVHRIVAELFVPNDNPSIKTEVNHLDTNRQNPRSDNLEWTTHIDNINYSVELGKYKGKFGKDNPNYGNDTLKKKFEENPSLKMKQSRPGVQNGRCRKLILYDSCMNEIERFDYIGACCEFIKDRDGLNIRVDSMRYDITCCARSGLQYRNNYYVRFVD